MRSELPESAIMLSIELCELQLSRASRCRGFVAVTGSRALHNYRVLRNCNNASGVSALPNNQRSALWEWRGIDFMAVSRSGGHTPDDCNNYVHYFSGLLSSQTTDFHHTTTSQTQTSSHNSTLSIMAVMEALTISHDCPSKKRSEEFSNLPPHLRPNGMGQ